MENYDQLYLQSESVISGCVRLFLFSRNAGFLHGVCVHLSFPCLFNVWNPQMLKEVVAKILKQNGITSEHKCFKACSQRLFDVSKLYLKVYDGGGESWVCATEFVGWISQTRAVWLLSKYLSALWVRVCPLLTYGVPWCIVSILFQNYGKLRSSYLYNLHYLHKWKHIS